MFLFLYFCVLIPKQLFTAAPFWLPGTYGLIARLKNIPLLIQAENLHLL